MNIINNNIYYVGVNDRNKSLFEGLWPLPYGVSYNSYLIDDDKVCLIDTVEVDFFARYISNIREVIGSRPVDYLVINHMEPDHSGSIALLRQYYPDMQVIGNKKTIGMLEGFYGVTDNCVEVKDAESIALGKHNLTFYLTPNIVGKYGIPVQNALKKLAGLPLAYICSTHGPVWHSYIDKVVGMYDSMSRYATVPGLVICYGTMYGNTERMAEVIAEAASKAGLKDILLYNVSKTHHSYILRDIFKYRGLIVGAPTYNAGLYHEMDVLLAEIANRDVKDRLFGWFGSYAWAGKAVQKITEWNDTRLHFEAVGTPVEMKQSLNAETQAQCEALGRAMAEKLLADE